MKSKQLNFFITPDDYRDINAFLADKRAFIVANKYIKNDQNPVEKLPPIEENISQVYLTKNELVKDAKIIKTAKNIQYYDVSDSPLLEFSLGGFLSNERKSLERARFYYIEGFYDSNDQFVYKSDEFRAWSNDIIKTFKKRFLKKYSKGDIFLYSKSAIEWIEENNAQLDTPGLSWVAQ